MKSVSAFIAVVALAACAAPAASSQAAPRASSAAADPVTHTLEADGLTRPFLVHAPQDLKEKAPLVILLHGGGGSAQKVMQQGHGREWRALADQEGFLLIAPNGMGNRTRQPEGENQSWNDYRNNRNDHNTDDVSFILELIDWAATTHNIDRARVYVTGASNGGMMTFRLLAEHAEVFAGGAAFIANLPAATPDALRAGPPVPLLIMNGTEDRLMPWEGGDVGRRQKQDQVLSARATLEWWKARNATPTTATDIADLPNTEDDGCQLSVEKYGPTLWFVTMEGAGMRRR